MWVGFGAAVSGLLMLTTSAVAADDGFQWQTLGAQTYAVSCGACHQPNGQGVPGAFPALAGHAPDVLSHPGGRDYLARLVLFGLEGHVTIDSKPFDGAMPPWGGAMNDEQLAAVLDHVLHSWGNEKALPADFKPFVPADIAAARKQTMTAAQVYALRGQVMPEKPEPATASVPPQFTAEQADRGHAAFRRNCQDCHGANLNDGEFGGAPLNGQYFARHWGNGSVAALFSYLHTKMPPDRPGRLSPQTYADLTAFLLSRNGYEAVQAELPADIDAQQRMNLKR
ncbi:MAG TPA: c-type cytochrome [Acetobacteraceae bacterium]|jgi:mono/diheme cytochrome c family protein|nr:c-type cytochrome [Acetobacteraceae bacterium]